MKLNANCSLYVNTAHRHLLGHRGRSGVINDGHLLRRLAPRGWRCRRGAVDPTYPPHLTYTRTHRERDRKRGRERRRGRGRDRGGRTERERERGGEEEREREQREKK